jgi:hypothetical protein
LFDNSFSLDQEILEYLSSHNNGIKTTEMCRYFFNDRKSVSISGFYRKINELKKTGMIMEYGSQKDMIKLTSHAVRIGKTIITNNKINNMSHLLDSKGVELKPHLVNKEIKPPDILVNPDLENIRGNAGNNKWSPPLAIIGEQFKQYYPNLTKMSRLPKKGPNVKILTDISYMHFEWYVRGPSNQKVLEVGLHIERKKESGWNHTILYKLKQHKSNFDNIMETPVFYGAHHDRGNPRKYATRISIEREFSNFTDDLTKWAVQSMRFFYDYWNPIISRLQSPNLSAPIQQDTFFCVECGGLSSSGSCICSGTTIPLTTLIFNEWLKNKKRANIEVAFSESNLRNIRIHLKNDNPKNEMKINQDKLQTPKTNLTTSSQPNIMRRRVSPKQIISRRRATPKQKITPKRRTTS